MKPVFVHPQARADVRAVVRYYRQHAGNPTARRLADALDTGLRLLQQQPGIGSPRFGQLLDIPGLRAWRVAGFPLMWFYFDHDDYLDVVRLLGERQDILDILSEDKQ